MRRTVILILAIFAIFFLLIIGILVLYSPRKKLLVGDVVGLIRIEGILAQQQTIFSGFVGSERVVSLIEKARTEPMYKGVVLRINSPGGTVAAAQEVYAAIRQLRLSGKPVVASLGDMAASGGYYIASACDEIVANPGTVTGSIGVIMEIYTFQGLFEKLGIRAFTFKEGKFKDIGNPARPVSREEEVLLQKMAGRAYRQFLDAVLEGRKGKITEKELRAIADGRPLLGEEALEFHLVDALGTLDDATDRVARLAGIQKKPVVKELRKRIDWWEWLEWEPSSMAKLWFLHFPPQLYWMQN